MVLAVRDESESALRCRPRVETFNNVALHPAMTEVNMALVTDLTIKHRADQVGRIMPQRCDVASVGSAPEVPL